jgi:heme-degrading monooxygenase HmoA
MADQSIISHWRDSEPEAPYYAVIFISRKSAELDGYQEMDEHLMKEVQSQDGYLGYSSQGTTSGGIFISYWKDQASIDIWRKHSDHKVAKREAAARWYDYFHSMICKVESSHMFVREIANKL